MDIKIICHTIQKHLIFSQLDNNGWITITILLPTIQYAQCWKIKGYKTIHQVLKTKISHTHCMCTKIHSYLRAFRGDNTHHSPLEIYI